MKIIKTKENLAICAFVAELKKMINEKKVNINANQIKKLLWKNKLTNKTRNSRITLPIRPIQSNSSMRLNSKNSVIKN